MSKEAMKLALEALENAWLDASMGKGDVARHTEAITALREALAEQPAQPQQEPVAWMSDNDIGFKKSEFGATPTVPLYTSPSAQRAWVGLTDEEVKHQWEVWRANVPRYTGFAKGIEAKLKEKNT